jgi:hypothetical protein
VAVKGSLQRNSRKEEQDSALATGGQGIEARLLDLIEDEMQWSKEARNQQHTS